VPCAYLCRRSLLSERCVAVTMRKALIDDVPAMQRLINSYASAGLMLPRSLHSLYEHLRDYTVALEGDELVGCVALHVSWKDLAEVRSLAVAERIQRGGIGAGLVVAAIEEAVAFGVGRVFALTFVPDFFAKRGFHQVDKSELPHKIWQECIHCVHFPDCGEVPLIRDVA
jgi:amino-acid N-acetyltransferase